MPNHPFANGLSGHLQSSESWGQQQALALLRQIMAISLDLPIWALRVLSLCIRCRVAGGVITIAALGRRIALGIRQTNQNKIFQTCAIVGNPAANCTRNWKCIVCVTHKYDRVAAL